jgi:hypothetical protein
MCFDGLVHRVFPLTNGWGGSGLYLQTSKPTSAPAETVVIVPVLAALGATCLGFGLAMVPAVSDASSMGYLYAATWGLMLGLSLLTLLMYEAESLAYAYRWAGDRAAVAARARAPAWNARAFARCRRR